MGWIIITIICALVGITALLIGIFGDQDRGWWITGGITVGAVWLVITMLFSVELIGARQIGVVYNFSGTITGQKSSGTAFIAPWQHVQTANVGVQREDFTLDQNNSAVSSDQQEIFANLSLNYEVDPAHVLNLYKTVGPNWKAILLDSRVLQDFKEVTSTFTAEQITTKRQQLRQLTKSRLTAELAKYDITVVDFFVANLSYTPTYQAAINAKNQQVQEALQAQAKVAQASAEAAQTVATAKGQAESIRLEGAALKQNPSVLQLKALQYLSPRASVIICTAKTCPSFLPSAAAAPAAPTAGK